MNKLHEQEGMTNEQKKLNQYLEDLLNITDPYKIETHFIRDPDFITVKTVILKKAKTSDKYIAHNSYYSIFSTKNKEFFYFPHKSIKKMAELLLSALTAEFSLTGIKLKPATCVKTCLNYIKCRMHMPNPAHLEQLGCLAENTCYLYNNREDRTSVTSILKTIKIGGI